MAGLEDLATGAAASTGLGSEAVPTGPRCQHLRLLKLQAETVKLKEASKAQEAVSDLLNCLSSYGSQHCTLPELNPLRLTHPKSWHEHAKGLCEQAGTSLAASMPGEEENMILEASRVDLEDRWAAACKQLHCIPRQLRPGRMTAVANWIDAPSAHSFSGSGAAESQRVSMLPVVVQMAVHSPDNSFHRSQAILLAGHHTLDDLRNVIVCVNDKYASQQLGSAPSGGYMLLDDVLYVDSAASAQEYTAPILSFLEERNSSVDHRITRYLQNKGLAAVGDLRQSQTLPSVQNMQSVRLCDLELTPGQHGRYMYGHCGACEHMLVVEDVRIKHATDPDLTGAPVTVEQRVAPLHRCCICMARPSTKIVWGDFWAPASPAFFCLWCYEDLHYGANGKPTVEQPQMDVFDVEV